MARPSRRLHGWHLAPAIVAVAFAARLLPVLQGGGLRGINNYDAGVYFGSAVALVHGRLPYRDFLLLHPPGITVVLAPFAALAPMVGDADAMAVARVAVMLLGGLNALLVAAVLRPLGAFPAAFAAFFYAVFFPAVSIEHNTRLEGFAATCLLGALILLRPAAPTDVLAAWRFLAAGALLGLATTIKIWGAVPLLAVAIFVLASAGARRLGAYVAGAAAAGTAICLPFFLAAPATMWQQVVLDQVDRPESRVRLASRLADVAGLGLIDNRSPTLAAPLVALALVAYAVAAVLAWRAAQTRLAAVVLMVLFGVLVLSPTWFPHYAGLTAAPLAVVVGAGAYAVRCRLDGRRVARRAVAVGLALGLVPVAGQLRFAEFGDRIPRGRLAAYVAALPGCIPTDDPSAQISLDVLSRNLSRGCPLVLDLGGYSYHLRPPGQWPIRREDNRLWQEFALDYLGSGTVTLNTRFSTRFGFSKASQAEVDSWPVVYRVGRYRLQRPG